MHKSRHSSDKEALNVWTPYAELHRLTIPVDSKNSRDVVTFALEKLVNRQGGITRPLPLDGAN